MGNACGCVFVDGDRDPRELASPPLMGEDDEQTTVESGAPSTVALEPQTSTRDAALMRARQARIARLSKARAVETPIRGMELVDLPPETSDVIALRV